MSNQPPIAELVNSELAAGSGGSPSPNTNAAIIALAAGAFTIGTTEFLPSALLPTISRDLSVSISAAGLLVSGYALGVTLAAPFVSAFLLNAPQRKSLMWLMLLYFVTNILAAFAPSYQFLMLMRFVNAFGHGAFFAIAAHVASRLVGRGREASAIGFVFCGLSLAMATIVPVGSLIGQSLGWRIPFAFAGLLGLTAAGLIARYIPDTIKGETPPSFKDSLPALRQPQMLLAFAIATVSWAGIFCAYTYIPTILESVSGLSPAALMLVLCLIGLGITAGNFLGGRAADGNLHGGVIGIFLAILAGLLAFGWAAPNPIAASVSAIALSVFIFSANPGMQLMVLRQATSKAPGTESVAGGLNQSFFNLGIAAGAFIGAHVVDSAWGIRATPFVGAILLLFGIALTMLSWAISRSEESIETIACAEA
ncbi:MFS transporter [bacterium]|nr:MAG: MFS transporter [bacterium]